MISTVTTVTTVTTTLFAGSFALITTLMLLTLLIQKEIISVAEDDRWQRVSRGLNVVILPIALAFLAIAVVQVMNVL